MYIDLRSAGVIDVADPLVQLASITFTAKTFQVSVKSWPDLRDIGDVGGSLTVPVDGRSI